MAGKISWPFFTDGLAQYRIAFNKVHRPARGPGCWHVRDIHIRNIVCNTNTQERLNGELADCFRSARGINGEDSAIFRIAMLLPNLIKPHEGIGGRMPAERSPAWTCKAPTSGGR